MFRRNYHKTRGLFLVFLRTKCLQGHKTPSGPRTHHHINASNIILRRRVSIILRKAIGNECNTGEGDLLKERGETKETSCSEVSYIRRNFAVKTFAGASKKRNPSFTSKSWGRDFSCYLAGGKRGAGLGLMVEKDGPPRKERDLNRKERKKTLCRWGGRGWSSKIKQSLTRGKSLPRMAVGGAGAQGAQILLGMARV